MRRLGIEDHIVTAEFAEGNFVSSPRAGNVLQRPPHNAGGLAVAILTNDARGPAPLAVEPGNRARETGPTSLARYAASRALRFVTNSRKPSREKESDSIRAMRRPQPSLCAKSNKIAKSAIPRNNCDSVNRGMRYRLR
jgi:hypothetical protein